MNGKRFKFNFFDFFICIIILLGVVFYSFYIYNISDDSSLDVNQKAADITFEVKEIRDVYLQNIKVGDAVIDTDDGSTFGVIKSIETSDFYFESDDITAGKLLYPEVKSVKLTLTCNLIESHNYYFIGEKKIIIGERYNLIIPDAYILAKCVSINIPQ